MFFIVSFARWKQVEIRLSKSRLFYEEASWYDGQIWEKPFFFKNDKLLSTQKIQPILQRILRTLLTLFVGILFLSLLLLFFIEVEIKLAYAKKFVYNKTID
jgi:hypothetical protein